MKVVFIFLILICGLQVQAQNKLDSLKAKLHAANETEKAALFHKMALILGTDSLGRSIEMESRALLYADPELQKQLILDIHSNLGFLYYKKSNFQQSIFSFNNGLELANEIGKIENAVKLLNNLGVIHQILGMYEEALDYLFKSLSLKKQLADTLGMAKTLNNISVIYKNLGRYDEAFNFTKQALDVYQMLNRKPELADVYNNLGTVYEGLALNDSALMYYYKSLNIKNEINNYQGLANSYNNIGAIYLKKGLCDSAYRNFMLAYRIRIKERDNFGLVRSLNNIGRYYLIMGNYDSALTYFNKSLGISRSYKMFENLQSSHANLARTFDSIGQVDSAYAHYKQFVRFKDTIQNRQIQDKLSNLTIHYETQKLEQEKLLFEEKYEIQQEKRVNNLYLMLIISILLLGLLVIAFSRYKVKNRANKRLSEKNQMISAKQQELEKILERLHESERQYRDLNATKDKLFSIIAHDLKSPFNIITSFADILAKEWDEHSPEERTSYLNAVRDSSVNTLRLLENLLAWARAQTGNITFHPEKINLRDLLDEVLKSFSLNIESKDLNVHTKVDASLQVWGDKNMLQTILRNLLSNAIKFTPNRGAIRINAICHPEECVVSVNDSGTGMTKEEQERLFNIHDHMQKEGTNKEAGTGLGLILCREFVDMHRGSIWVHSSPGEGSEFYFSLPRHK